MTTGSEAPAPIHVVLLTYRRPHALQRALLALGAQSFKPVSLVVVDNDAGQSGREVVDRISEEQVWVDITYLATGENLGPAGGRALGADHVLRRAEKSEWVLFLDDDDPLPESVTIEDLFTFGLRMRSIEPRTAGVGYRGGWFEPKKARFRPLWTDPASGAARVNHLHGGFFPLYLAEALRAVGLFRGDLFYGFEELELGLRLDDAGYSLFAFNERRAEVEIALGHPPVLAKPRYAIEEPDWTRYYALRNLLVILLSRRQRWVAARVALVRGIVKPGVNIPIHPRWALSALRGNSRAILDAYRGRLGRTVEPARSAPVELAAEDGLGSGGEEDP